jgi:hypothetical protein
MNEQCAEHKMVREVEVKDRMNLTREGHKKDLYMRMFVVHDQTMDQILLLVQQELNENGVEIIMVYMSFTYASVSINGFQNLGSAIAVRRARILMGKMQ